MDTIPIEILAEIFRILTVVDRPLMRPSKSMTQFGGWSPADRDSFQFLASNKRRWIDEGTPALGWVNVTFVSRLWRECAIQNSALWTHLPDAVVLGARWLAIFIERGREAGLHYDDRDFAALNIEPGKLLTGHLHHIGILRLTGSHVRNGFDYHTIVQRSMPSVTELSLQGMHQLRVQSDLPRLRRLRLWGTTFLGNWPPQLFTPNITSFECYPGTRRISRAGQTMFDEVVDMTPLFHALQKMSGLNTLALTLVAKQPLQPADIHDLPQVVLPSLTRLDVSGVSDSVHTVLRFISIPSSASIRIAPSASVPVDHAADEKSNVSFIDYFEKLARDSGLPDFYTVEIVVKQGLVYFAGARHRFPDISFAKPSYDLTLELPASPESRDSLAAKVLSRLCKADVVRELHVSGSWHETAFPMLCELSQVVLVDLMGPAVGLLLKYMAGKGKPRRSPEKRLGGRLETLALHHGHVGLDQCKHLVECISAPTFRKEGKLKTIYLSKANLSLLGDVWKGVDVEVIGV